ncbi:Hsp33 family molecular chaperone HslO [Thioalkalivibrio sp.]|uniref:Hsp33 family molecular chaperone HslO n=1 Tax=Thioalkalivibrio sp. TaxID=2093813 RepID=UPI0012D5595A|nr:Hsp33 family molecular chaperone HslO [Thioalkalivibrio sp.]TVP76572.1 MAG: Hsp33 family molecular chaperone HslO [Thioalkalivibrio sp.]
MTERDTLHRFLLERTPVRGEWVHLDDTWRALLERHPYPPVVRDRLGEAYAAVALIAATLKFDGSLILQITGSGPLHMLVVQATGSRALRGLARYRGEVPDGDLTEIFGPDARLVLTLDPGAGRERYQGVVALEGQSLAAALDTYFERSEQLPTRLWLASGPSSAAGLLLQGVPGADGAPTPPDAEDWIRATLLGDTVSAGELLALPAEQLLRRLFHEERVRLLEGHAMRFACNCSRDKVEAMLKGLGADEVRATLAQEGEVLVTCEFCNASYRLDAIDAEALFAADDPQPDVGSTRH